MVGIAMIQATVRALDAVAILGQVKTHMIFATNVNGRRGDSIKGIPVRSISFALTTRQIRERSKTVTRRLGWKHLRKGDLLQGVVKGMGLKPGESPEKLAIIVATKVEREPLNMMSLAEQYGDCEAVKEGFPELRGYEFVRMFAENMKCEQNTEVTRIEFRFIPGGAA